MIPSAFVAVPELPLTANGKVDRGALPEPDWRRPELAGGHVAPRTPVESMLAALWAELLEVERVGIHDSFFDLGGHSLKAAHLVSRLGETLGVQLPLRARVRGPNGGVDVRGDRRPAGGAGRRRHALGRPSAR